MSDDSLAPRHFAVTSSGGAVLETEICAPAHARLAVVVAHPSPQYGGDMHSIVVEALFRHGPGIGVVVARFNFRGVGASSGRHDGGAGERDDLAAVLDHVAADRPDVPLAIAGYSFGAEVALTVDHPRSVGWFVVAPVLRMFPIEQFIAASDARPKRLVVAQHDQYMPPIGVRESTRGWKQTTIDVARMVDHFFAGGTGAVVASFDQFVDEVTAAP